MQQLSLCATTTKPELTSLGAATAEAQVCPRAHALRQVKPPKREAHRSQLESSPRSLQPEKSPQSNEDPAQARISKQRVKSPPLTEYGPPARRTHWLTWSSWHVESSAPGRGGPPCPESRWVLTVATLGVDGGLFPWSSLDFRKTRNGEGDRM